MAKKKVDFSGDGATPKEQELIAQAEFMLKKRNYKPIPKFKGGCKDC